MQEIPYADQIRIARAVGWALLSGIVIGIVAAMFISAGIDINLSAGVEATARNMLDAETRLRAQAYIGVLGFALSALIATGCYLGIKGVRELADGG